MASLDNSSILVIGGTGFIGHHLLNSPELSKCNLYSLSKKSLVPPQSTISYYAAEDLLSSSLDPLFSVPFDYVVNLGGYVDHSSYFDGGVSVIEDHHYFLNNLLNRLNLSSLKRFVQIGSSDEYGLSASPQHESQRESPISPYSFAKTANTHLLRMLYTTTGFPSVILRVFLAYGPNQSINRFIPFVIHNCLHNNTFNLSACDQVRDFIYIDDLVSSILMCFHSDCVNGEVFNVGSGSPVLLRDVVDQIKLIIGAGNPIFGGWTSSKIENISLYPSLSKIQNCLDWKSTVPLSDGLRKTIDSYR